MKYGSTIFLFIWGGLTCLGTGLSFSHSLIVVIGFIVFGLMIDMDIDRTKERENLEREIRRLKGE